MNKTKKELYIENQKLKKERRIYREFWETDAIETYNNQIKVLKTIMLVLSIIFLIISIVLLMFV